MKIIAPLGCAALLALVSLAPGARAQDAPAAPPPAAAAPSEPVTLRLRLEVGKTFNSHGDQQRKTVQTIYGRQIIEEVTTVTDEVYTVESIDAAGNYRITSMTKAIQWRLNNSEFGEQIYDSRVPGVQDTAQAQMIASAVGTSTTMRISPTGKILSIVGMDAVFKKMATKMTKIPAAQRAALLKQMKEQFGDKTLVDETNQWFYYLPEKPVRVGDTWKRRLASTGGMAETIDTTFTLKERRDGIAVIEAVSTVTSSPKGKVLNSKNTNLDYRLAGKLTETLEIDEATGWQRSSRSTESLKGSMIVTGIPGRKKPLTVPTTRTEEETTQWD